MNKTLISIGLVMAAVVCGYARADDTPSFDDRFYMAPAGTYVMSRSSSNYGDGYGARIAVGKLARPHLGVELLASYLYQNVKTQDSGGGGLCGVPILGSGCSSSNWSASKKETGSVGAGLNLYLFRSNHGLYAHVEGLAGNYYGYAGGLGYDLHLNHQGFGLRLQALYHKDNPDKAEPLFNAGFFIPFGDAPVTAVASEQPVRVVPVEAPSTSGATDAPPAAAGAAPSADLDGILPEGSSSPQVAPAKPEAH